MINATHDQTFEQRLARLDLTAVMAHVADETGMPAADLARAEDLYRKFLTLKARYPLSAFVPPRIVDTVWHTHITFTRQYAADCQLLFGSFLHHEPRKDGDIEAMFTTTRNLYQSDFNINLLSSGFAAEDLRASFCP